MMFVTMKVENEKCRRLGCGAVWAWKKRRFGGTRHFHHQARRNNASEEVLDG
jgi:hypothetical protein